MGYQRSDFLSFPLFFYFESDEILWVSLGVCHGHKDGRLGLILHECIVRFVGARKQRCHYHPFLSQRVLANNHATDEHGLDAIFVRYCVLGLSRITRVDSKVYTTTVESS